jgi:hypothetical protein
MRPHLLCLLVLVACGGGEDPGLVGPSPTPVEVSFRVLSEGQNATFCVEGPEFAVAMSDEEWIEIYSRQSDCQESGESSLPQVRFDDPDEPEWALAAWWRVEGCLGYGVETRSVMREGATVTVSATSSSPGGACATAVGGLESFLAVPASAMEGSSQIRFVLDGEQLGTTELGPAPAES